MYDVSNRTRMGRLNVVRFGGFFSSTFIPEICLCPFFFLLFAPFLKQGRGFLFLSFLSNFLSKMTQFFCAFSLFLLEVTIGIFLFFFFQKKERQKERRIEKYGANFQVSVPPS